VIRLLASFDMALVFSRLNPGSLDIAGGLDVVEVDGSLDLTCSLDTAGSLAGPLDAAGSLVVAGSLAGWCRFSVGHRGMATGSDQLGFSGINRRLA